MLKDPQYKNPNAMIVDPDARYSDRHHMQAWTDEKDQLEKVLTPKQTVDAYKKTLEQGVMRSRPSMIAKQTTSNTRS